jgi:signal transduction histidine kinase/ActR/RegA family two-component response regulator
MVPRKISAALGLYVLVAGVVSFAGWVFDLPRLADWADLGISIQPNTAVAAMAMGAALLFLAARRRHAALVAASIAGTIGAATLFEHLSGVDLRIDRLLLFDRAWGSGGTLAPGRMGPPGAIAWTLLGAGVWLTSSGRRARGAAAALSIVVMLLSALSLVGYLFNVQQFYALPRLTAIALQTATMIFAASIGLMFAVPERGLAATSHREDAGSLLLRRMVVPVFLVPLLFGWLRLEGERAGLYDTAFGDAAFVIFTTTALLALLAVTARHLGRSASALEEAAHTQRVLARIGELAAKLRDTGNLLEAISETVAKALSVSRCGFARVELERGQFIVERDYHEDWRSIAGPLSIFDYGRHLLEDGRAGRPTIVADVRRDRDMGDELKKRFEEIHIRSQINVPLHREGRWVANLWVAHHEPRQWTDHDVELLSGVAERVWLVLEKARAVEEQRAALQALAEREAALREADRRKNEFLATLAHELRNPLAPVVTALELIKVARGDLEMIERCRVMMDRQLGHTVRLVDDLLDVSRLSRDSIELRRERIDLESVVESAMEAVRPLAEETGHEIEIELPSEPVRLDADPVRLSQVLTNLLTNACKYTPPGGRITLGAQRRGAAVEVRVTDTGIGMPPELIPSAFEIFSQLNRPVAPVPGGLGIGLSLVKSLVEKHGGTISAHSEGPGHGTEFVVTLPVEEEAEAIEITEEDDASSSSVPVATGRVLVVDDNIDAANTLAAMLSLSGYETEVTHDGASAVEKAAWYSPSAILLDIGLPDMNGYDVCRAIRQQPSGQGVRIVAVTGWGAAEDRSRSADAGFDAHLVKPVSPPALLQTLSDLLASCSSEAAQYST